MRWGTLSDARLEGAPTCRRTRPTNCGAEVVLRGRAFLGERGIVAPSLRAVLVWALALCVILLVRVPGEHVLHMSSDVLAPNFDR
jgi:hypothetical protein